MPLYEESHFQDTCYRVTTGNNTKPVLLMIHGVGLNQDMWLAWLPVLCRDFRVVTLDLYGHGGSGNPAGPRHFGDFCEQIGGLVNHLEINRFSLLGFSLGALISQAYASRNSDRLGHLILLHGVYRRSEAQCRAVRERYRITREQGPMATVELAIERWFTESYRQSHTAEMDTLREVFAGHTGDGYLKAYYLFGHAEEEMKEYDPGQVTCPALVITGEDDVGSTPAMSRALAGDLPDAQLIINPAHRHMAPVEFVEILIQQVLAFLRDR